MIGYLATVSPFSSSQETEMLSEDDVTVQTNVAGWPSVIIFIGPVVSIVGGRTAHKIQYSWKKKSSMYIQNLNA